MAYEYPSATIINTTGAVTGRFGKLQANEDTVIASLTAQNIDGASTSITLNASCEICGVITGFTLASGSVIAYRL
jgi:hypothetical protein|tara:strand:- start:142 stop:366 length:225 start_codon:yes stop_codon:yes gene_type:complete